MIQGLSYILMSFLSSPDLLWHTRRHKPLPSTVGYSMLFNPHPAALVLHLCWTPLCLLSVLSGKPSKTLWISGFFLPPTMLRSLFGCDSSSSKGFPVFMLFPDPMLEPCSCGLCLDSSAPCFFFPSFCAVDRSSPKHLGNLCQLHCSYRKCICFLFCKLGFL